MEDNNKYSLKSTSLIGDIAEATQRGIKTHKNGTTAQDVNVPLLNCRCSSIDLIHTYKYTRMCHFRSSLLSYYATKTVARYLQCPQLIIQPPRQLFGVPPRGHHAGCARAE